jgi:superfamily II DNA or RNA helicase
MSTFRERNNLASKKSYEKALEKQHATEYEYEVIRQHRALPNTEVWHWSTTPEDHLYDAGYITDYNKLRLERLMNKKDKTRDTNRLKDYGIDALVRRKCDEATYVYDAIQAKYYLTRQVTAGDIGSFLASQLMLSVNNNASRGYLYTTANLQPDLAGFITHPEYPIKYVKHAWKHTDKKATPATLSNVKECDLVLRPYQMEAIEELKDADGINALHIPCRMGKTLIAGHILRHKQPDIIIAIAPLKISVKNLQDRLECFLPAHKSLLVDSDTEGTTDATVISKFLEVSGKKIIYSTYKSFVDVLSGVLGLDAFNEDVSDDSDSDSNSDEDRDKNMFILADEIHNTSDEECELINQFQQGLVMSATYPENLSLDINETVYIPFSLGINEGYLVDYSLWLPHLINKSDGTTAVDVDIPVEFSEYSADITAKALYLAVVMLKTGSRRCIAYLSSIEECEVFRKIVATVFEEYHGITTWTGKIDSSNTHKERDEILQEFQNGSDDMYHILTSVRILDEAVDIPRCDSVFIGNVSEHSSVIRFMQRCMRSSTIDPQNPNKHNNIILWADGWEKCVDALELLRVSDPDFKKKVRVAGVNYDSQTDTKQKELIASEASKFGEWIVVKSEDLWEKKRQAWAEFYRVNGRSPIQSSKNTDEKKLGSWQADQRILYKRKTKCMTAERIRQLECNTPGWIWDTSDKWQSKLEQLIEFYDKNNRFPSDHSKDSYEKTLGRWLASQRKDYKDKKDRMTPERIKLLESNNWWVWNKSNKWMIQFTGWIKFYKENRRRPSDKAKDTYERKLGRWQSRQRVNYNNKRSPMTKERIKLLEEQEGWIWEEPDNWNEMLNKWIKFYTEHKRYPSNTSTNLDEKQVGAWQSNQRQKYRKKENIMTPEKIVLLEAQDGWVWRTDKWNETLKKWENFYKQNSKNPSQHSTNPEERTLAQWQSDQRFNYKHKNVTMMTPERIKQLEETPNWKWSSK